MSQYELLVLTRSVQGTDDEFNRWYDQRHLSDVLAVPGFVAARRYRVLSSDAPGGGDPPQWHYVAIYEMECEDPHAALAELGKRVGTELMPISNSLERAATARFVLREINSRSRR